MKAIHLLILGLIAQGAVLHWRVGLRTFGPIAYGMTLEQASKAVGQKIEKGEELLDPGCSFAVSNALPAGASLMVLNGRIARVDVDSAGIPTLSGAEVGWTEDQIRRLYPGQIRTEPHPYTGPEGHYLVYVPRAQADRQYRIIFETDGKRVLSYRAGRQPAVSWIEGCS